MEHSKWQKEIPYIQFPADWNVQISPPFAGAVVRFRVKKDKAEVSIYLDCYDKLGCYGEPYWEVYPHEGDVYRCDMADTESLLNAIKHSILEQNSSLESELVKRGWAEDRDMFGRYISPYTKITYKIEQACRIEDLL